MSRIPDFPPPAVEPVTRADYVTQVREYELLTPFFGGGAATQEADPVTVVRVPSIRGQLRFWWRACRGASQSGSLDDMRGREEKLWGMAGSDAPTGMAGSRAPTPSAVSLRLEVIDRGAAKSWREVSGVDYAIFPLRGSDRRLVVGVKFAFAITYPQAFAADVEAALWAWETFGGLGARTRRGFGAVRCLRVDQKEVAAPADRAAAEAAIRAGLQRHVLSGQWPQDLPHLTTATSIKVSAVQQNASQAWSELIGRLKSFRQFRSGSQGRSFWPEPDAIRGITRQSAPAHSEPIVRGVAKFPRAQFGLPIIFHFRTDAHRRGDPGDTSLEGKSRDGEAIDRLASPLLLRPLPLAGGRACGLAVILDGPRTPAGGLVLKRGRTDLRAVDARVTPQEATAIKPLRGKTDVLQAFLDTL